MKIIKFLQERSDKTYTMVQIASFLGLKKEDRIGLQFELNKLHAEGIINKIAKRYTYQNNIESSQIVNKNKIKTPEQIDFEENYQTPFKSSLFIGKFDATPFAKNYSFAFVLNEEGKDIYISSEDTLNAYHGDLVEVEITRKRNDKLYGQIKKVIQRNKERFVGVVEFVRRKAYFRSDNLKINRLFEVNLADQLHRKNDVNHREPFENSIHVQEEYLKNQKVLVEVINWGGGNNNKLPVCKILDLLGISGNPETEFLSVVKEFDLPLEFSDEVLAETQNFSHTLDPLEIQNRKDFRQLYTITIDPHSAKDYDDAISLVYNEHQELLLYVHIADVGHYVLPGSTIYQEAVKRGNSYYFPKKVIPMLPEVLSNKLCSLRPDEDKYTITVLTVFDHDYRIIKQDVFESVIRSNIRLSYEEVDIYFAEKRNIFPPELSKVLDNMRELSSHLSSLKNLRGYLMFDFPEVEYVYDDEGYITELNRSLETESHVMIENFMLIANEFVSKLLACKAKKTLYRIHEQPEEKDLQRIKDLLKIYHINYVYHNHPNIIWQNMLMALPNHDYHRVFDRLILRSMKKAKYSTKPISHFGLAIKTYTHFTSPIRRLCDLIIHLQLKHHLFNKKICDFTALLDEYSIIATEKELLADEAERYMENKMLSNFMKNYIGTTFSAIICNLSNNSILIELDELPIRGVVKLHQIKDDYYVFDEKKYQIRGKSKGRIFQLCDQISVILESISEELLFSLAFSPKKGYGKGKIMRNHGSRVRRIKTRRQ